MVMSVDFPALKFVCGLQSVRRSPASHDVSLSLCWRCEYGNNTKANKTGNEKFLILILKDSLKA